MPTVRRRKLMMTSVDTWQQPWGTRGLMRSTPDWSCSIWIIDSDRSVEVLRWTIGEAFLGDWEEFSIELLSTRSHFEKFTLTAPRSPLHHNVRTNILWRHHFGTVSFPSGCDVISSEKKNVRRSGPRKWVKTERSSTSAMCNAPLVWKPKRFSRVLRELLRLQSRQNSGRSNWCVLISFSDVISKVWSVGCRESLTLTSVLGEVSIKKEIDPRCCRQWTRVGCLQLLGWSTSCHVFVSRLWSPSPQWRHSVLSHTAFKHRGSCLSRHLSCTAVSKESVGVSWTALNNACARVLYNSLTFTCFQGISLWAVHIHDRKKWLRFVCFSAISNHECWLLLLTPDNHCDLSPQHCFSAASQP